MMSFSTAIATVFRKYAEFEGRATRPEFWWFVLFSTLVSAALNSLTIVTPQGAIGIGASLAAVWSIGTLLPTLAVTVRRLRDGGYAWGHVFWILLPVAGVIVLIVLLAQPSVATAAPEDGTTQG